MLAPSALGEPTSLHALQRLPGSGEPGRWRSPKHPVRSQCSLDPSPLIPHRSRTTVMLLLPFMVCLFSSLRNQAVSKWLMFYRIDSLLGILSLRALCARATSNKIHKILGPVAGSSTGYQTSSQRLRGDATIRLSSIAGSA